jgi:hypothetical protein
MNGQSSRSLLGFRSGFKEPTESGAPIQKSQLMMRELNSDKLFHNPDHPFLVRTVKADLKKMKLFKIVMTQKSTAPNTRFATTIS